MDDLTMLELPTPNGKNDYDDGAVEEDEYDVWNDETFGDTNLNTDWEESHEILSGLEEQSKNNFDDENGELSKRVASFILDDENDDIQVLSISKSTSQLSGNTDGEASKSRQIEDSTNWWNAMKNKKISWPEVKPVGPNIKTMLLNVQDLERSILMQSSTSPQNQRQGKLVLQHVEDVERELKNNAMTLSMPVQKVSNQIPSQPGSFNMSLPPPLPQIRPPLQSVVNHSLHMWMNQSGHNRHGLYSSYRPQGMTTMADFRHFNNMSCMLQPMIGGLVDPYMGLMTPQEKQWLASIQVMQLSTASQAYQDDYYYLMYQSRQQGSCRKLGNQVFKSNREVTSTKNTYIPLQFENSLGKLQVGSVTAPRKIIDVDYSVRDNADSAPQRTPCRTRKILLEIEWMYNILLKIEELNYFSGSTYVKSEEPVELANNCINKILIGNKFLHIMEIRKGRNVVLRLIAHLRNAGSLIYQLISNMIPVTQKDSDQTLLRFLPAIRTWLSSVSLNTLIELCDTFEDSYEFILSNKFTVSVLTNMIERAEKIISSSSLNNVSSLSNLPSSPSSSTLVSTSSSASSVNDINTEKWLRIIETVAKTANLVKHIERPVVGINAKIFSNHLARIQTTNGEQFTKLQVAISTTRTSDISV